MGWWPLLVLVVLSAVAATTALLSQQLTLSRAANAVPNEGFYWSVAQYQIAHHRLKQEPVSYTHLDVYKRQVQGHPDRERVVLMVLNGSAW